jgi:hypothetical protein
LTSGFGPKNHCKERALLEAITTPQGQIRFQSSLSPLSRDFCRSCCHHEYDPIQMSPSPSRLYKCSDVILNIRHLSFARIHSEKCRPQGPVPFIVSPTMDMYFSRFTQVVPLETSTASSRLFRQIYSLLVI